MAKNKTSDRILELNEAFGFSKNAGDNQANTGFSAGKQQDFASVASKMYRIRDGLKSGLPDSYYDMKHGDIKTLDKLLSKFMKSVKLSN